LCGDGGCVGSGGFDGGLVGWLVGWFDGGLFDGGSFDGGAGGAVDACGCTAGAKVCVAGGGATTRA
jgi:hypothetical protein